MLAANATANIQNALVLRINPNAAAFRSGPGLFVSCLVAGLLSEDAGRKNACSGAKKRRLSDARTISDYRHPSADTIPCVRGQNTVLASPPASVSVVMAFRASLPNLAVITAKAGSYNTIAIVRPSPAQIK